MYLFDYYLYFSLTQVSFSDYSALQPPIGYTITFFGSRDN